MDNEVDFSEILSTLFEDIETISGLSRAEARIVLIAEIMRDCESPIISAATLGVACEEFCKEKMIDVVKFLESLTATAVELNK